MSQFSYPAAPIFGVVTERDKPQNSQLYLDDIFDEFLFSAQPDRGIDLIGGQRDKSIDKSSKSDDDDFESFDEDDNLDDLKKRKRSRGIQRNMTEEQKVERRYAWFKRSQLHMLTPSVGNATVSMRNDLV
jgi:hypothetical protein